MGANGIIRPPRVGLAALAFPWPPPHRRGRCFAPKRPPRRAALEA